MVWSVQELDKAEKLFSSSIDAWEQLSRPRDEKAELYKFRANARVDLKRFEEALVDYNEVLNLMNDGEKPDGTARYMEYPDTYVQRGLCYEGLYRWEDAVRDYDKAVKLWGGGRGQGELLPRAFKKPALLCGLALAFLCSSSFFVPVGSFFPSAACSCASMAL
eukprot:1091841-Rhodomonas_salina.1